MLYGGYDHTIDKKGRIAIPAKLRDAFGDTFMIEGKHYLYMKTLPMSLEDDRPINTIVLNDGSVTYIDEEKETVVVECQLRMVREGW